MGPVGLIRRFNLAFKPEQALGLTGHFHMKASGILSLVERSASNL